MGLGNDDEAVAEDGDYGDGGCGAGCGKSFGSVPCSICLDVVDDSGDRSWAKLQCGHQFHLDCIGSAFNIKGAMQCPNCRKIEKGQWLYANGCRSFPDFSMDDWTHEEDLYDLSYSEMAFGVQWCPFGNLARLPPSFEDGDFSSTAYHDLLGQHAYLLQLIPVHILLTSDLFIPLHQVQVLLKLRISVVTGMAPHQYPVKYHLPMHFLQWIFIIKIGSITHCPFPQQTIVLLVLISRRLHPLPKDLLESVLNYQDPECILFFSSARVGSSVASSMIPPYPGSNARARDRVQALQAYYQQPSTTGSIRAPAISGARRSSSNRGLSQAPMASSSDQPNGFYFYSSASSGRNFQLENTVPNRFHPWERDHLPSFGLNQMERDPGWGEIHQGAASVSDPSIRSSSFRQRHGPERASSQNWS
ncbi:E3 ubiquitin-protein ligase RFI2 [Cucurbita argyrosperma subsp. argyrosperma]|nr:E3 ubiquitin-protein ligase RFI2 [Cucurbita argyrosperma subsp. argyrosperma]